MKIVTVYKTTSGSPLTGLSPLISIQDITNMFLPVPVISEEYMYDLGLGFYGYDFEYYEEGKEYTIIMDADSVISGRYQYGSIDKVEFSELANNVEDDLSLRDTLRIMYAVLANKSSGGNSPVITFRNKADSKNRITASVDEFGNRLAVTIDPD